MTSSSIRLLACTLIAVLPVPGFAQAPAAAPALGGNPVPGICLLSRQAIFANAKIGIAASARLTQLGQEAQAEVDAERKPIDAEVQAYQTERAKLTSAQHQSREQALAPRLQAMQAKVQQRGREIEATRAKALERISTEAQPVIASVYKARGCGLLIDRNSVLGGNFTNDLTAAVVQGLDAKIGTITFNRETLPAQTATAGDGPR